MVALGLLGALVATVGGAMYLITRPASQGPNALETVVQLDANNGRVLATVPNDTHGSALATGDGSVWEISYGDGTLLKIDNTTRAVVGHFRVPGNAPPVGVAVGPEAVWVTTAFGEESLERFDPKTGRWQPPTRLASGLEGVAYGMGAVWVADKDDDLVFRVDPATDIVTARIPVGEGPEGIAVGAGAVWVANAVGKSVSRIDTGSATVTATIGLTSVPSAIAAGENAVWIVSEAGNRLIRIDPATDAEDGVDFGIGPSAVAARGQSVWVAEGASGHVSRIDAESLKALATMSVAGTVDGIATDGHSVWLTSHVLSDPPAAESALPRGGTLRVAVPIWEPSELASSTAKDDALDPQVSGGTLDSSEILRCCLVRTLTSHVGMNYREGGAVLRPDLALGLPNQSADGLTWTFRIRPGVNYAPPLQRTEITAADFIRSLQRDARLAQSTTYSVITGYDAYAHGGGNPTSISGLEAPDRYTLVVHLDHVATDLPARFALPESGPIPPSPVDLNAPFGVATGHDSGYGRFLVSSGPYMIEGSAEVDFSQPATQQQPTSGFHPGRTLVLVRNPSWRPALDHLRPAYLGRLQFAMGMSDDKAAELLDGGLADLILHGAPPPQVMPWLIQKFDANPRLGQVQVNERDFQRAIEMNLAIPPFDDVHVRRAVNYILDKRALIDAHGGGRTGAIMSHYNIDSLEDGALSGYRPYGTPDDMGSIELAMNEMKQSRYDPARSGMCSASVCKHVLAATIPMGTTLFPRLYGGFPHLGALISGDLSKIGITLDVESTRAISDQTGNPAARIPLDLTLGIGVNWMSASSAFSTDFSSQAVSGSLVGATSDQLRAWGYSVASVPNIDSRIDECMLSSERQNQCWIALDVYVMEKLVPMAPYLTENVIDVVPKRVVHYSFDQSSDEAALDQIAVAG